jgi:hypothetical protein
MDNNNFYTITIKGLFSNRLIVTLLFILEFVDVITTINDQFGTSSNILTGMLDVLSPLNYYELLRSYSFTREVVDKKICDTKNQIIGTFLNVLSNDFKEVYIYNDNFIMLYFSLILLVLATAINFLRYIWFNMAFYFVFVNILNIILRHCSLFILYIMNDRAFYYLYKILVTGNFSYLYLLVLIVLIEIVYIGLIYYYINNFSLNYPNYPYDYCSIKYDKFFLVIKVITSIKYPLDNFCLVGSYFIFALKICHLATCLMFFFYYLTNIKEIIFTNEKYNRIKLVLIIFGLFFFIEQAIENLCNAYIYMALSITLFSPSLLFTFVAYKLIIRRLENSIFQAEENHMLDYIYLLDKYYYIQNENNKAIQQFDKLYSERIYLHSLRCQSFQNCLLCSVQLSENESNETLLKSFKQHLLSRINASNWVMNKKSSFYYLARLKAYYTIYYGLKLNDSTLKNYFLIEMASLFNNQLSLLDKRYYEVYFNDINEIFTQGDNTFGKNIARTLIDYLSINETYEKILKHSITIIERINTYENTSVEPIYEESLKLYKLKKELKASLSKFHNDKDSITYNFTNINYELIFNKTVVKGISYNDKVDLLDGLIKYNENKPYFILEFIRESKKLFICSFNKTFYKKLGYKRQQIKSSELRLLFPEPLARKQKELLLGNIENPEQNKFDFDILLKDNNENLKLYTYQFRTFVEVNLKTFVFCEEKKTKDKHNELLLIVDTGGEIAYSCKNFKNDYLVNTRTNKYNLNDIFKIELNEVLSLCKETIEESYSAKSEKIFHTYLNIPSCYIKLKIKDEDITYKGHKYIFISFYKTKASITRSSSHNKVLGNDNIAEDSRNGVEETQQSGTYVGSSSGTTISNNKLLFDENLASVLVNHIQLFTFVLDKNTLKSRQRIIYAYKILIIIVGVFYLVYLNNLFTTFSSNIMNYLNSKTVENSIYNNLIRINTIIKMDNTSNGLEDNLKYLGKDSYTRSDLANLNDLLLSNLRKLDVFFSANISSDNFYYLYNEQIIQYISFDTNSKSYNYSNSTFIQFLKLYLVHMNNLSNTTQIISDLQVTNVNDFTEISLLFVYQNLFPAIIYNFSIINTNVLNSVFSTIDGITSNIILYNIGYILSHMILISYVVFYLFYYRRRVNHIYLFLFNLGETHLKYLLKKFQNLKKIVHLHLDLSEFKKKISDLKVKPTNINNHLLYYKDKELTDMKVIPLPFITHMTIYQFIRKTMIKTFAYIMLSALAIIVVQLMLETLKEFITYRYEAYAVQSDVYKVYLLVKMALISNYGIISVDWVPEYNFKDKGYYIDQAESYFQNISNKFDNIKRYESSLSILHQITDGMTLEKDESICDIIIWNGFDLYVKYISRYGNQFLDDVKGDCKQLVKKEKDFSYFLTYQLLKLRKIIMSLNLNNSIENRLAIFNGSELNDLNDTFQMARTYFKYFDAIYYRNIIAQLLNNAYYFCLSILVIGVTVDLSLLYLTQLFVLNTIYRDYKVLITSLNILKK